MDPNFGILLGDHSDTCETGKKRTNKLTKVDIIVIAVLGGLALFLIILAILVWPKLKVSIEFIFNFIHFKYK
jgi:hypothetical protein